MSNTFDKLSVLDSFIEEVNSYLPEIDANLARLAETPGDMEALEETYRRTHTIGGSASMMDFPGLAHVAHGMEDILGDVLDGLASLDAPTLGLLQRSFSRLRHLIAGIRDGVDEDAIVAEDDADYTQYRAQMDSSAFPEADNKLIDEQAEAISPPHSSPTPMPSLDDVLASFRTPVVVAGEEVAWPEDPVVPAMPVQNQNVPDTQDDTYTTQQAASPSALEMLITSTRHAPVYSNSPVTPRTHPLEDEYATVPSAPLEVSQENVPARQEYPSREVALPPAFDQVQQETQALKEQASSLKQTLTQLRLAMSVIENQRIEFKGFLDGSKDALDRMEEWAGQAMGLNLRNSPEQVRRYLPLSVMWVANSKLKKVLELLNEITTGVGTTDEQIHNLLQHLSTSLVAASEAFQQAQVLPQNAGWTPWEVQVSRDAEALRERVTFERQGNSSALRAEVEAKVREELRREYESRPIPLALRTELEQQIRNEVRKEFEAKRQLQERITGVGSTESLQEVEARLRNELEIQVRQEFLNQITGGKEVATLSAPSLMPPASAAPRVSNFVDHARAAAGIAPEKTSTPISLPKPKAVIPPPPVATPVPRSVPPPPVSLAPSLVFGGEFGDEAADIFRLEAEEHLQTISMHVAALEKAPTNRDLIQGIRRATHTLKGAAGMMGFRAIADLCHISEDLLDNIMEGTTAISPAVLSIVLDTAETLDLLINGRGNEYETEQTKVQPLRARYAELLGEQNTALSNVEDAIDAELGVNEEETSTVGSIVPTETNAQRASRGDLSVRVRLQKLDELVNLFGELLVNRSVLQERVHRLESLVADVVMSSTRLRDIGQKLDSGFEAATLPSGRSIQVMPGQSHQALTPTPAGSSINGKGRTGPSHLAEFDELELDRYTEFHRLARGLSESVSDMTTLSTEMDAIIRDCVSVFARENRLSTTFQDRLMKARLVPLETMTPRLYRAARAVALKQHKEFEFMLEGEETEVDRTVYEEIAGPLLHLMRNAVNHAIETPEVRQQKGKSPVGQIKLSAAYEGNRVVITVRDDGMGLDPERIRSAAIARGLISSEQRLSDNDVIDLIFRPGFSTAEVLSEESGRGVGLDVVRDSVSRLRGTIEVESMPGQGTAFTMKFPTSLAIQSVMMVRVSEQRFAIPTVMVEAIGRSDGYKRVTLGGRPAVLVQNTPYPLHPLSQYLSLPPGKHDEKSPLVLVNTGRHRIALVVDEIKGKMDVVMKNLGPHLRHVQGIAGGTVLGNGQVVLILELAELLSSARSQVPVGTVSSTVPPDPIRREVNLAVPTWPAAGAPTIQQPVPGKKLPSPATPTAEHGKHILVVDDSPSVRRVVSNMLKQNGWEVQMARDGVEALDMITHQVPAAVLLDVEMPRMDGYELIATVRAQEQYRTLPLIVLTSRAAGKHQQRAVQLGASDYIVKPYQDEELLSKLNTLIYGAATR